MNSTCLKGVNHSCAYLTTRTGRAKTATLGIVQRVQATERFPAAKAYHFLNRAVREISSNAIDLLHSSFPINERHYDGRMIEYSREFRFVFPKPLFLLFSSFQLSHLS